MIQNVGSFSGIYSSLPPEQIAKKHEAPERNKQGFCHEGQCIHLTERFVVEGIKKEQYPSKRLPTSGRPAL